MAESEIRSVFFKIQSTEPYPTFSLVMDTLATYGINNIFPESLFLNYALYPTNVPGVSRLAQIYPDVVEKAHARGIKVHAHMNVLLGSFAGSEAMTNTGAAFRGFSCPTKVVTRNRIKALVQEIASLYDIDGFMPDYVRYDNQNTCYCPECKAKFEAYLRETIPASNWGPTSGGGGDFSPPNGSRYLEFMEWRCHPLNDLSRDIGIWLRQIKPNIVISGAVWPVYSRTLPAHRKYDLGQDWFYWIKEGYVDEVHGMAYGLLFIKECVQSAHEWGTGGPQGKVPYVSFLADGASGLGSSDPATFNDLVEQSRSVGAEGFNIYTYGGPGDNSGYAPDIRPILDAINLFPTFSIKNISVQETVNNFVISWKTDLPATSKVEYSASSLFSATQKTSIAHPPMTYWDIDHVPGDIVEENTLKLNHSITIPSSAVYFRIQSADANGIATSKVYTVGEVPEEVTADFSYAPTSPGIGETIQFTDQSNVPSGKTIVTWNWKFGDGVTSALQNPTHAYGAEGNYTVTLTVTDNDGITSTTGKVIAVMAPQFVTPYSEALTEGVWKCTYPQTVEKDGVRYRFNKWIEDEDTNPTKTFNVDAPGTFTADYEPLATIKGTVKDAQTGQPIISARVQTDTKETVTDELGNYVFTDLPIGVYTVSVSAAGYTAQSIEVDASTGGTFTGDFSLTPIPLPLDKIALIAVPASVAAVGAVTYIGLKRRES